MTTTTCIDSSDTYSIQAQSPHSFFPSVKRTAQSHFKRDESFVSVVGVCVYVGVCVFQGKGGERVTNTNITDILKVNQLVYMYGFDFISLYFTYNTTFWTDDDVQPVDSGTLGSGYDYWV